MAQKRKRKTGKEDPFKKSLIRQLHSVGGLLPGLNRIRSSLRLEEVPRTIDVLLSVPIYKVLVVGKLFPKRFDSIRIRLPEHTPDRIRDFLWEASLLGHFSSEINSFVVYRSRYESALFAADYETCESTLNELEACHGLSLWLVDARINLLQMKDGLSAQRSYLEGLIESPGVDRVPAYLAFWFSHRTDPNVSAQSIADEAEEVRNAFGGTSIPGDFFTSFIDPANTFAIGQPHHCIYGANDAPLFDRYLNLVRMLVLEFARHGSKILVEFEPIMACLTEISDSSLETIKSFGSKPPVDDSSNINLIKLYDEYASGQYLDAYSAAVKDLSIKPSSPLYELVVRSGAYGEIKSELNEGDGIAAQIFRAVSDMSLLAPGRDTASARLKKLSTSLGFTSIAAQLRSLVSGTRRFELNPVYDEADRVWAMTAPRNHPWHLALFEEILETSPEPEVVYSTSPSHIVEAVINGKIDSRELTALHLDRDDGRHLLYRGRYNAKMQNYELAAQLLTLASNSSNSLVALSGRIFLYGVLLKTNRLDAASNLLAEAYYANPNSWVEFDYSALITNASLDADLNATFQFANIAFVAMKHISQSYESVTSDAFDRVLDAHEVERPSELIDMYPDPSTHLIFFLRSVCSVRVMEDSYLFSSLEEVEAERVVLCGWVARNSKLDAASMEAEVRSLVRSSQIASARTRLNQSKIYVDEGGIGTELAPQMREQYNRYVQLLENPHLDAQADQINKILGRILEKTNTIEGSKFNADLNRYPIPSTERHGVLQRAFAELAEWFVTSPEFGLDAHLSSNIRHGTFLGHSRSPFLKRRLIIAADSEDNGEEIFDFWRAKLPDLTSEQMSSLKSFVGRFSSETNKLVDRVNDDIIRVRDGDHPNGLFKYDALADTQERLAASISLQTTFDEFMDAMFDMCWRQTESSMAEIREYLLGEFQEHIGTLLDSFELGIERSMDRLASPEIFDAIVEARTDFSNSIQRISEWFRRPNRPSDEPLAIDIVVDVAVKEVQSCFLEREFRPTIKLSEQLTIRGRKIDGCVEILFILFQNAIKHNYDLLDLNSTLTVDTDGKTLFFSFLNDLSPTTNHAELQAAAIEAQRRYNGEDALAKVRTEGGSGLSKIWRTAEHTMKVDHSVSLSVSETTFLAEVMLGIEGVQ